VAGVDGEFLVVVKDAEVGVFDNDGVIPLRR
jgi:hypothetical protein